MTDPVQSNIARRVIQTTQTWLSSRRPVRPVAPRPTMAPPTVIAQPLYAVWFDITLEDEQQQPVQQLQVGNSYTVVITGSLVRSTGQLHAEEIYVLDQITLHWRCLTDISALDGDAPGAINTIYKADLANESVVLSSEEAMRFRQEFTLQIPAQFPSCNLLLELSYTLPEKSGRLGQRRIPLIGTYTPENTQWLTAWQLTRGLPDEVAVLAISSHPTSKEEGAYKLRGWHRYARPLDETAIPQMVISLPKLMQRRDLPMEILAKMRRFSNRVPPAFKEWLLTLYKRYGADLCIIIIDSTALEIPWELIEFEGQPALEAPYLGAMVRIVRWLPREYTAQPCLLAVEQSKHSGSVVAYLDQYLGQQETVEEMAMLKTLEAVRYPSLQELEARIYGPLQDVGLIYIGCHGLEGKTLQEQIQERGHAALTSISLELIDPRPEPRPTVFINACESARIIRDNIFDDSSFVEAFLYRCASGFLGTLGRVGTRDASRIARHILTLVSSGDGGQIAGILRDLRAAVVREWRATPYDKRLQLEYTVLYTFMYVYYGNPLACLYLQASEGSGNKQ